MHSEFIVWLASDSGWRVYAGLMSMLLLGGIGFPIPEDIPILLAGVLASKGVISIQGGFLVSYVGVLIGDQTMFFIGHRFGHKLLNAGARSPFFPTVTPERVNELREGLRKRRLLVIFIGRHIFPIRSATFVTAGAVRIPFIEFLLADALAALVSVSIVMGFGYFLGESLTPEMIDHISKQAHFYMIGLVLVIAIIYFARRFSKGKRKDTAATAKHLEKQISEN